MPSLLTNPWVLLGIVLAALSLFGSGTYVGDQWSEGKHAKVLAAQEANHAKALTNRIESDRKLTVSVATSLLHEREARDRDALNFEEKLRNVSRESLVDVQITAAPLDDGGSAERPSVEAGVVGSRGGAAPDAADQAASRDVRPPAVHVRLSAVSCRLWNDALRAGLTEAERPGWPAGEDTCPGPAEIEDALVSVERTAKLLGECRAREQEAQLFYHQAGLIP